MSKTWKAFELGYGTPLRLRHYDTVHECSMGNGDGAYMKVAMPAPTGEAGMYQPLYLLPANIDMHLVRDRWEIK